MSLAEKAKSHFDSACAFLQRGAVAEAISQLSQAISLDLRPEYHFHRAHLYLQLGDIPNAEIDIKECERLLDLNPDADLTLGDIEQLRGEILNVSRQPGLANREKVDRYATDRSLGPLINEFGFGQYAQQLLQLVRPSMRLKSTGGCAQNGGSKLGGFPDVPPKFPWPQTTGNVPMAFVAQINCSEAKFKAPNSGLPNKDIVYLYYDYVALTKGQTAEFQVFYYQSTDHLSNVHAPENTPQDNSFFEAAVFLIEEETLPAFNTPVIQQLLPPQMKSAYDELLRAWYGPKPWHRLLGWSQPIGVNSLEAVLPGGRLLLQIDTDPDCCMQWSDGGRLFVATRDAQPLVLDTPNCKVAVQSY
jgi:hypothetical protein